ncbi:protein ACCELERATED CELL DEATH 6-like [Vigna radiata var. radiata]|uniref:Protein ACCELERATED CELL DEATH 6-like n=1 Tax=Vigna radiata var. radiata TaxID=3916 RepID=A0A3Q0EWE0_VIGRR|nr:protein ACCELERATED CELL DEATH 6-like [Vigna radiata var. radiata]
MALMDTEKDTRDISMPTFSKDLGARSPAIVAILKENKGILEKIINRKKELIHDKDEKGRNVLHYAASKGYLNGVECLLQKCDTCNMETDRDGFYPLHLASACGHIQVVKKLLENCPNPREIIDKRGRNIVHIAAIMGQFDVVRYALEDANGVKDMINDKDYDGNTPLHLAASHYRPKIVQALTWDTSVDLNWVNNNNQTPLDAFEQFKQQNNPPIVQRLTWCQLKSAGVQNAERGSHSIEVPSSPFKPIAENTKFYKDRINTLMVVSTLITTVAFAGGITLPGGTNSSAPEQGMAVMLNQVWFKPYILCTTISMYGGISVTIILIWAQLGDVTLALFALKVASPLLGITLATLSMAFLAGVHLVISDLSWLATTVLILCVVFIILLLLLYTLLWFPSESSNLIMRYISFYPFQFLTWLTEKDSR